MTAFELYKFIRETN
jgi:thiol-disulfide isomerase/thioredoxin